jgi:hypothetical protein
MKLTEESIQELVELKLKGESYSTLRKRLLDMGLSREEVSEAIKKVDEKVLLEEISEKNLGKTRQIYRAGLILAIAGLLLTLGASRGIVLSNLPKWIIYSPFFVGILLMYYGRKGQRKQPQLYEKGPGRIRKKRPYK